MKRLLKLFSSFDSTADRGAVYSFPPPASSLQPLASRLSPLASSLQPPASRLRSRARRGVLLLVVLSLLVLFALIGITFVLVASQSKRTIRSDSRADQTSTDYRRELDNVLAQIVRDVPPGPPSVLRYHSLLNDMYGLDGVKGTIFSANYVPSLSAPPTQFIDIYVSAAIIANLPGSTNPTPVEIQTPGYFNGCVFSMANGPAANLSARIVGWGYSTTPAPPAPPAPAPPPPPYYTIRIMAFDGFSPVNTANPASPNITGDFVINGRPFNGTGFGFNPLTGRVDATQQFTVLGLPVQIPYALLPNPKYFVPNLSYPVFGGLGGADEDYDAADPQNMFLAYMSATPVGKTLIPIGNDIIPSFHRPDLVAYMSNKYPAAWKDPTTGLARQVLMRPFGRTVGFDPITVPTDPQSDHPNFTGSNSTVPVDPIYGPWDVDNDGDGVPDSVWLDVGFQVRTAPDGRRYKPLAAILCLDLDGRLNVNAHGSLANVDPNFAAPGNLAGMAPAARYLGGPTSATGPNFAAAVTAVTPVGAGTGYGPADVSLAPLFTSALNYKYLLTGDISGNEGRYGQPDGGVAFVAYPFLYNQQSPLGMLKHYEYPVPNYPTALANYPYIPTAFGTPPDLWGRGFIGLDVRGTPLMLGVGLTLDAANNPQNDTLNNPYELNLSRRAPRATKSSSAGAAGGADNSFTPVELERILRLYDLDASALPDRLRSLLDTGNPLGILRHIVTTDSFDLPSPNVLAPAEVRTLNPATSASQTIIDLLRARIIAANVANGWIPGALTPVQQATLNTNVQAMLPNEVVAGLRMDINRPFGNGRDDNVNGVVDEPGEATIEKVWFPAAGPTLPATPPALAKFSIPGFDADNDGFPNTAADQQARQLYARHLYVLMLLLIDPALVGSPATGNIGQIDWDNNGTVVPFETQRAIAQWAVNVVDFKDRDSIMTPFPFMLDPFTNGWTVSPIPLALMLPGTDVVWGCERPELLITETLAFHDRRTEDTNKESDPTAPQIASKVGPGLTDDKDFDQRLLPLGSFFVELYNPWTTHSSTLKPDGTSLNTNGNPSVLDAPGEFYDVANAVANNNPNLVQGVQLDRRARYDLTGSSDPKGSPVWRLLVVKGIQPPGVGLPYNERKDPDDPIVGNRPIPTNQPAPFPAPQQSDDIERSIYFFDPTNVTTNNITGHGQPYFPSLTLPQLLPGRYAVVGSAGYLDPNNTTPQRYVTPIGRPAGAGDGTNYSTYRQIALTPGAAGTQVQILNNGAAPTEPAAADIQPVVAVVIDKPQSVSISEPTGSTEPYYAAGLPKTPIAAGSSELQLTAVLNKPLDVKRLTQNATIATDFAALAKDGTTPNFRTIHLQRLANPLVNWDAVLNPYLTIDTMTVDLTVFNGVSDPTPAKRDPSVVFTNNGFASLQRGSNPALLLNSVWQHQIPNASGPGPNAADMPTQNFQSFLLHSLGYLNKFAPPAGSSNAPAAYTSSAAPGLPSTQYVGAPNSQPFDWLTWNNRPFANAMELMLVPKSRSSKLLYDYVNVSPAFPYAPPVTLPVPIIGHLLNFFQTAPAFGQPGPPGPNFHRLFEYVQTPSRFVGTETELNPVNFTGPLPTVAVEQSLLSFYHPPFNTVSNYRDPGKININTIPSDDPTGQTSRVWNGLMNGTPVPANAWSQVMASRRGYNPTPLTNQELIQDSATMTWPSYFSNPFRSFGGAPLTLPTPVGQPPRRDVDVTLLRPNDPATSANPPLFNYLSTNAIDNSSRNPYFRNQIFQRLANSITTRSNVYAIWITVGYFEVTPAPAVGGAPPIYPDGYQLGQEMGSDTGDIKRHRAFYIYDRSIPVGFEPGHDHNFDKGVLVKRFIE